MAGLHLFGFFLLLFLSSSLRSIPVRAQFSPGNVPLASRSAYFNSRLDTRTPSSTASTWPSFGPPSLHTLGWAGYIKVDNTTWRWIGNSVAYNGTTVNTLPVTNTVLTPTRTTFTMNANTLVQLNVSFLSPIPTDDLVGLSVPFAYVTVDAVSLDGAPHDVKVYSDISGEWLADDTKLIMEWDTVKTSPNIIHTSTLQTPQLYTDGNGQARWGTMYYATAAGSSVTYKVDSDINCRTQFQVSGTLDNAIMTAPPRGISDSWPVLAHAHDLGTISSSTPSSTPPVIIAIGFLRSPAVQLTNLDGDKQDRALFYETAYSDPVALVNDFIANYTSAAASSVQLDSTLTAMAAGVDGGGGVGTQLADMVALGVRQVLSNTEVTVAKGTDGAWNASDVVMFMRQGDGEYNRTQPVELLYASFPMFMSLNPALGKPLLEPLLRLQSSSLYGNAYAAPDLSSTYPNASLANQPHQQGVEQTGNMLVMSYAQARYSGDSSMVETYYTLLRSWADYLINNSLAIGTQLTTDTTTTRNQTNLAIKGILGVKAFSAIASGLGVSSDAKKYSDSASDLYSRWKSSGALGSAGNLLATFNSATSYSTGYNLFADKWLGLGVVEDDVYAAQTTLVKNLLGSGSPTYGLPIDSTAGQVAITSWDMFVAALMTDPSARSSLVGKLYAHAGSSQFASPWPLEYNAQTGDVVSGTRGSPGQGAIFAPMALSLPTKTFSASSGFTPPPGTSSSATSKSHAGAIAGGVVGGVAGLALLSLLIFFLRRRRRHNYELAKVEPLREQNGGGLYPHAAAMAQMNQNNASTSFHPEMLVRGDGTRPQHASNPSSSFVLPGGGGTTDERSGGSGYGGGAGGGGDAAAPVFAPTLPAVGPNGQPLSSKALMHLRHVQNGSPERSDPSALYTPPSEGSAGRRAPSSANGSGSGSGAVSSSGASTDQLRQEVDLLRREMAQIRAAGLDLPPGYE